MVERIVDQPLTQISVYQCPSCTKIINDPFTHQPYRCPFCAQSRMTVLRTEYEARGPHQPESLAEHLSARPPSRGPGD
jgi:hypothetical protein